MRNIIKFIIATLFVGAFALALGVVGAFDLNAAVQTLTDSGGVLWMVAPAAVVIQETVTTDRQTAASATLLTKDISKNITLMRPDISPLDTMLRRVGDAQKIDSWTHKFYSVDVRGDVDTLKSAFDTSASGTYNSNTGLHTILVNNIHIWNVNDTIFVPESVGSDGKGLVLYIAAKSTGTSALQVIPINPVVANDLPDLAKDTVLVRMGPAKGEEDAQTDKYAVMPTPLENYCQIHMAQVEETFYAKAHSKEVRWDINDYKAAAIYDMRRSLEYTSLFGAKSHFYDPEKEQYIYTSDGITRFIDSEYEYNPTVANANSEWLDLTKDIFTGNSGSKRRFIFAGSNWIKWCATVDSVQRQRDASSTEEVFGIKFNKIVTDYGELLVIYHYLLDKALWSEKAIVLDMNFIERKIFKAMEVLQLDLKKSGQKNADAFVLSETSQVILRYPDCHRILVPKATS